MKILSSTAVLLLTSLCGACSSNRIVIDPYGVEPRQYAVDRAECEQLAASIDDTLVLEYALVGAFIRGFTELVFAGDDFAPQMAAVGAIEGGSAGAAELEHERQMALRNCLLNRGYAVLN